INARISRTSAEPATTDRAKKLKDLNAQLAQAQNQVSVDQQQLQGTKVNTSTLGAISGSVILDPATALVHSKTKYLAIYALVGLIAGLAVGMGIVVVKTIVSDRLRRRDDVSRALGVPVRYSVGPVRLSRWRPGRRGLAAARQPAVRRITAHLRAAVPRT